VGAPGMASRNDLFATACGNGDRDSRKSHAAGDTPAGTYHDGVVLYSGSGHAGSAKITTYFLLPSSPETIHSFEALINANVDPHPTTHPINAPSPRSLILSVSLLWFNFRIARD
jgi:hypothetical protein